MLLWFVGTSVVTVWFVFHDSRFDYRLLVVGSLAPDVIDGVLGGAGVMHSLTGSVVLLVGVVLATVGRRARRRRLLALPIGTFLHLIFDGAFTNTTVFWWPLTGEGFDDAPLPSWDRGLVNIVLELAGAALCWWAVRFFGLTDPDRRRRFFAIGTLEPVATVN
jgi:hypothetical protein